MRRFKSICFSVASMLMAFSCSKDEIQRMSATINGQYWIAESIYEDKKPGAIDIIGTMDSLQIDLELITNGLYNPDIEEGNYPIDNSVAGALVIFHYPNFSQPDTIYDAVLYSGAINITKSKNGM